MTKQTETSRQKLDAIKEDFIARYLHATGSKAEDVILCEQHDINTGITKYWCEPKGDR